MCSVQLNIVPGVFPDLKIQKLDLQGFYRTREQKKKIKKIYILINDHIFFKKNCIGIIS